MNPPDKSESLEKLLRLKRYEQPPPRYFNEFSGRVLDRIARGEGRASWWARFGFDLRPALAAGVGAVACGLIVYGVATTEGDAGTVNGYGVQNFLAEAADNVSPMLAHAELVGANSTNPVPVYGTPVDRKIFSAQLTPVSFQR